MTLNCVMACRTLGVSIPLLVVSLSQWSSRFLYSIIPKSLGRCSKAGVLLLHNWILHRLLDPLPAIPFHTGVEDLPRLILLLLDMALVDGIRPFVLVLNINLLTVVSRRRGLWGLVRAQDATPIKQLVQVDVF